MINERKIKTDILFKRMLLMLQEQEKCNDDKIIEKNICTMTNLLINVGAKLPMEEELSLKLKIALDVDLFSTYESNYKIIKFLYHNLYQDSYNPSYTTFNMSNKEVLDEVCCFLSKFGDFFTKALLSMSNNKNFYLEFNDDAICSESYFIDNNDNETYVIIKNHNNICKFTNAVHELQHCIDVFNNRLFISNILIRESSALFMEMIGADYFAKNTKLFNDGNERKRELHSIINIMVFNLYHKTQLLKFANLNMDKSQQELLDLFDKKLHITEHGLDILTRTTLNEDYTYVIAYIIAIELYNVYKQDEEKAIYILINIIMYGTDDNIYDLLENYGIKICQNVMKYEKKLFS